MACKSCISENQQYFNAEINLHFPGLKNLDKPTVWIFPRLLVCMNCGFTEFSIPEAELRRLAVGVAEPASTGCRDLLSRNVTELVFRNLREVIAL